jgi:predicted O-methyltransferase YrrM
MTPIAVAKSIRQSARGVAQNLLFDRLVHRIKTSGPMSDPNAIFNYAARGNFGIISPIQSRVELVAALKVVQQAQPRTTMELGTANGGTLFMLTRVSAPDALILSLDLPGGDWGGGYGEKRVPLYEAFALPTQTIKLLRADSHQPASLDMIRETLEGRTIDFLFIDGDHSYEGVKMDYEMYSPLVTPGGLIGFHDIAYPCGVTQFWNELKPRYEETWEFIAPSKPIYGIALARTPK